MGCSWPPTLPSVRLLACSIVISSVSALQRHLYCSAVGFFWFDLCYFVFHSIWPKNQNRFTIITFLLFLFFYLYFGISIIEFLFADVIAS
jgi:hypothetical protein